MWRKIFETFVEKICAKKLTAELEPDHRITGSLGQRFQPGQVGSRVKSSDPVPSLADSLTDCFCNVC